jgi:hypothetical protein
MTFNESLVLAVADKLLIGLILAIAGYWLNWRLEKLKGQLALQNAIAPSRTVAFGALWHLTQPITPRGNHLPSEQECANAYEELRKWYYAENGALYLSLDGSDLCLKLISALEGRDARAAKKTASALRTQLKIDLGMYTAADAEVQIPRAG